MKYPLLLGYLLMSSPLLAASIDQNSFFYLSAAAGLQKIDFNNTFNDQTDSIQQNIAQTSTQRSYTGTLALSYRRQFNNPYFLGAELSGSIDGHYGTFKSGDSSTAFSDQIQMKNHFDLTMVPGLRLSDSISVWLKLGLSRATLQDSVNSPAGYTPIYETTTSNKNVLGFAAALGAEKKISKCTSFFAELGYHDYGSVSFPGFQNFSANYSHSTHIYSGSVVVGALWSL